jgi:hypothetical protein
MQICLWSIVAMSQAAITTSSGFYATRALLGVLEGGFIPDLILFLSYFYTSKELPVRLSFFWTSLSITGIISSLLAYAIFHLEGAHGIAGWRWLFLLEGLITLVVGIVSIFMMPASAVQTKSWFRPNGWFSEREEKILVNRILRDDPSKGSMMNRKSITPKRLWRGLKDYDLWPVIISSPVTKKKTKTCPDLRTRNDRLYSSKSTGNVSDAHSTLHRIYHLHYQSSHNPTHSRPHYHALIFDLAIWETQPARSGRCASAGLDTTLPHFPCSLARPH